ncbi:MAG TPA: DUF1194 domain-containing protein [Stellaceae bacterium]|nr:DUF1194 domain-containing protein [Stellaceae bacterium]
MRARLFGALTIVAGLLLAAESASAQADVALVMAVDVSSSVNDERFALQRDGIAKGLQSPAVLDAVAGGPQQTIELAIIEWSEEQSVLLDWTIIRTKADLDEVVAALHTKFRPKVGWKTDIGGGIAKAVALLDRAPLAASRRVIDVSGDGQQNCGHISAEEARSAAVARDITINGLPITSGDEPEVDRWYEEHVVGGDGAFMIVANGHERFADAMRKKLALEIAGVTPPSHFAATNLESSAR